MPEEESSVANCALVKKASLLVPPNYVPAFRGSDHGDALVLQQPQDWAEDVVAVIDNGLRAELTDMYDIFESMEQRPLMLDSADVQRFSDWFATFFVLLAEVFDLEERVLFTWVEGVDLVPRQQREWESSRGRVCKELSDVRRARMKADVMRLGNEICQCEALFERRPVAPALPELANVVEQFVEGLVAYLELKRVLLPTCIRSLLSTKDAARFYRSFWELAERKACGTDIIVMVTRWRTRKQGLKWRKKHMSSRMRKLYTVWEEQFMTKHCGIVAEFEERVRASEAERVKQAEEHGAALARAQELIVPEYTGSEAASSSCASSLLRTGFDAVHEVHESLSLVM